MITSCAKNQSLCVSCPEFGVENVKRLLLSEETEDTWVLSEEEIVYIHEGEVSLTDSNFSGRNILAGHLVFLSAGQPVTIRAVRQTYLIIFSLKDSQLLCKHSNLREEFGYKEITPNLSKKKLNLLPIKRDLTAFFESIRIGLENEWKCGRYFSLKSEELFLLLKTFYTHEELDGFFCLAKTKKTSFYYFVLENYPMVKTVKGFAVKANLSVSAFEKEFRRIFNISPYKWMMQKRIERLTEEIVYGNKPLKEVSEECGFPSVSQMNDFCKKHIGASPGIMRKGL